MPLSDASDAIIDAIDGAEEMPPAPDNAKLAKCILADDGNADRLMARFGHDLCYTDEKGWLAWNGQYWDAHGGAAIARQCAKRARSGPSMSQNLRTLKNAPNGSSEKSGIGANAMHCANGR
jgi:hypothetical protein